MIKNEGNVAAIMLEPVVGTNGVLVPPKEYLPMVREIADKNDVLLIVDEVMSGWGRTGGWGAENNWRVKPDSALPDQGKTGRDSSLGMSVKYSERSDWR